MEIDFAQWLNLALRWLHLIAGIAWIGSSFYFIWLDNHLRPAPGAPKGVAGELWAVHGGGFYHKQKYVVAPEALPEELHWFKWEAYTTWLSGFFLLGLIYYLDADIYLINSAKLSLSQGAAVALGLGVLVGGWLIYDGLCRSPIGRNNALFGVIWFAVLTAAAYGLGRIFSDRGAYIHIGAIIGTAMAANVFVVIIPNQKKLVAAMLAGGTPDPTLGIRAKQRSLHNNYMTLPVLFIMVSGHYPITYGNPNAWALLAALGAVGWVIRHFFNLRHKGDTHYGLIALAAAGFVLTALLASWSSGQARLAASHAVDFAQARAVIDKHCIGCHSASPKNEAFDAPPLGVAFDTAAQIHQAAPRIKAQAIDTEAMPLGNETDMTMEERAVLGRWIADGAKVSQ